MSFQIILLAVVQGLTEFFPVSSSAHLSILQTWFGFQEPPILLDLWLHLGTVGSILLYYRKDLYLYARRSYILPLIATTFATGIIGLALRSWAEIAFINLTLIGVFLFVTAGILTVAQWGKFPENQNLTLGRAFLIGVFQGLAVFPGISRSGMTMGSGIALGLSRKEAIRYAFLSAVPTIILATGWETFSSWHNQGQAFQGEYILASLVAMVSGWGALKLLVPLGEKRRFHFFALYCIIIGGGILVI